jgi:hypothetical protein
MAARSDSRIQGGSKTIPVMLLGISRIFIIITIIIIDAL